MFNKAIFILVILIAENNVNCMIADGKHTSGIYMEINLLTHTNTYSEGL